MLDIIIIVTVIITILRQELNIKNYDIMFLKRLLTDMYRKTLEI